MSAASDAPAAAAALDLVLITGMSGSGKSVALRALEDAGYYCVDNLPPELLQAFLALPAMQGTGRVAVAIDARSRTSLPQLPALLKTLGGQARVIFLDANDETLTRRFSETRRRHPLSAIHPADADALPALAQAITREREMLDGLRSRAHVIDTSHIRPAQLASAVKSVIAAPAAHLTLVFESFGFKRGAPLDADYLFDVRMLPNPYYEPALRQPEVAQMQEHIASFLQTWLPRLAADHRSYVTVAIGCTGGQHRSVYLAEQLARQFAPRWSTLARHRELG